jgi:type II secretory pathway pseudopilin PulG
VTSLKRSLPRRGFTLLELVIVFFVLVILTVLIVPALRHARPAATRATKDGGIGAMLRAKLRGRIVFDPPPTMKQGEQQRITVRISPNALEDLTKDMPKDRDIVIDTIDVLPFMTVKLNGDEAFKISSLQPDNQFVSTDRYSEWNYDVRALKSGIHELDLTVGIRLKMKQGGEESRFYPLYARKVAISVGPWYTLTHFATDHWEWFLTVILIPLIGYWWKTRKGQPATPRSSDEC